MQSDQRQNADDCGFNKTIVAVESLCNDNETLIARSQAKRLLAKFEKSRHICLDFKGIETIGQAFADEIFRVYKNHHPELEITTINTSEDVLKMIRRASAT